MGELEVEVKLFASLAEYGPKNPKLRLPNGSTVNDLLGVLGLPADARYIVLVNTIPEWNMSHVLADGEVVAIFPPLAGG